MHKRWLATLLNYTVYTEGTLSWEPSNTDQRRSEEGYTEKGDGQNKTFPVFYFLLWVITLIVIHDSGDSGKSVKDSDSFLPEPLGVLLDIKSQSQKQYFRSSSNRRFVIIKLHSKVHMNKIMLNPSQLLTCFPSPNQRTTFSVR